MPTKPTTSKRSDKTKQLLALSLLFILAAAMTNKFVTQLHAQLAEYDEERKKRQDDASSHTDLAKRQRHQYRELLREIVRPVFEEAKAVLANRCRVHIVEDRAADENPDTVVASIEMTLLPKTEAYSVSGLLAPKLAFLIPKETQSVVILTEHTPYLTDETVQIKLSKLNSQKVSSVVLEFTASIFKV